MKKQLIEQVQLDAIQFKSIQDQGQQRYVAHFETKNKKNSTENLKSYFTDKVLDRFRALFFKSSDVSLRHLSRPKYIAADKKNPRDSLVFSISPEQYAFYCENKSRLVSVEQRHKFSYLFLHQYELPGGQSIYMQRIPDDDVGNVKDIASYFRDIIRHNKKAFSNYFEDGRISAIQNNSGRFIIANFIKTSEDYASYSQIWCMRV